MTRSLQRHRSRVAAALLVTTIGALGLTGIAAAAPAGAIGGTGTGTSSCRDLTVAKARVHLAATGREATLALLVAKLQARQDPWSLNGPQISALQSASSAITTLDAHVQSTCYSTRAAFRTDATPLWTNYRVYWLRVPQTHVIEAADRLSDASTHLSTVATKLATHVGGNTKAQSDLAAMNAAIASAVAKIGTPPAPTPNIAAVPGLAPAVDMTADVAALEAARSDLMAARSSLEQARADGLAVIADLGA
jgi:hypothetical protein